MGVIYVKIFKLKRTVSIKILFLWINRTGNQQYFYIYTYTQKFTERVLKVDLVVFIYFSKSGESIVESNMKIKVIWFN